MTRVDGRRGRTVDALVGGALIAILLVVVIFAGGGPSHVSGGARDREENGRLVALLLLESLGFDVEIWSGAPADLPRGGHLLWLGSAPPLPAELAGEGTPPLGLEAGADALPHRRDPRHYRRFLEEGGLLLCGLEQVGVDFLSDALAIDLPPELRVRDGDARARVVVLPDEELVLAPGRELRGLPPSALGAEVLVETEDGEPVALELAVGRGALLLLPDDGWLRNAGIESADAAVLLARLAERVPPGGRVLLDDYSLGGWRPEGPLDFAFSQRLGLFSLHALLALALLLWSGAWPRAFPREDLPPSELSPATRARSTAALLLRARRADLLARMLRAGVLRRLARRAGLRGDDAAFDPAQEIAPERVDALAEALVRDGADAPATRALWRAVLVGALPRTARDLEHQASRVSDLERRATTGAAPRP